MSNTGAYIAVDWGTTNRRAYLLSDAGDIVTTVRDDRGILALAADDYPADIAALRATLGDLPMIVAGMVGSNRGWHEAPYADAPADLAALAASRVSLPEHRVTIVPGVSLRNAGRADVMRGEEVQVLGAIVAGMAPANALFCQPGTHNKWVATQDGRVTDIATAMTGELFALLRGHGILSAMLDGEVADGDAFRDGLARGIGARDLTVALFEVRARVLLGRLDGADAAAFASGLLIGADVGSRDDLAGRPVHLLAAGTLADLYATAIQVAGGSIVPLESHPAFVAGIHRLWEMTR